MFFGSLFPLHDASIQNGRSPTVPHSVPFNLQTEGKITYSTFDDQPVILETAVSTQQFSIDYPAHIQQPLIQQVVNALNGVGSCNSMGDTAVRTSRVMDQMLQNYYNLSPTPRD